MYVPILKNRTIELSVMKELVNIGLNVGTIPLFEIIQAKSRSNSNKTYIDELEEIFSSVNHPFFLDFPKLNITASTAKPVQEFLTKVNRQHSFTRDQFALCKNIMGIIPVLSFRQKELDTIEQINFELESLHDSFNNVALRLTPTQVNEINDLSSLNLIRGDYVILDIDDNSHTNPVFKNIYKRLSEFKLSQPIKTIIVNSNRPQTLLNKEIIDDEPIQEIDNSLLEMYSSSKYRFDAFGDYACITNTLPTSGGSISPAGIYYSFDSNYFIGYRGKTRSLDEFKDHIAPSIIKSTYWHEFTQLHHEKCPGCSKILDIVDGKNTGKSQGVWKGITMSHYIYSLDENNV